MVSLTPQQKSEEVSTSAFREGLFNGGIALIPSYAAVWAAMRSPKFVKSTNWQSRTALVIMPALFTFAFTAERKLDHKMQEIASEQEHIRSSAEWAERKHADDLRQMTESNKEILKNINTEEQLMELYRKSVANSGVRIVPGDSLGPHHKMANFFQENPFKILAAIGVPSVAWIFYGRQDGLQLQQKMMHTRVMGQFTVITLLLSLMGFKEYMDHNGKFITGVEADRRVDEMKAVREGLLFRLEAEKAQKARLEQQLKTAHDHDVEKGQVHEKKAKKAKSVKHIDTVAL